MAPPAMHVNLRLCLTRALALVNLGHNLEAGIATREGVSMHTHTSERTRNTLQGQNLAWDLRKPCNVFRLRWEVGVYRMTSSRVEMLHGGPRMPAGDPTP